MLFLLVFRCSFTYLAALGLSCGMLDLHCGMQGSFVVAHGLLSSCGAWALEHAGSAVAARGLLSTQAQ